ncbi:MAG: adenosylmethionine decarboxylase [Patescibacteria group bacterium]
MKQLGTLLAADLTGCNAAVLDDLDKLEEIFKTAAVIAGATVVNSTSFRYAPQGVSVMVVISESHVSTHTWPEYDYAAVDFFTCGESVDPYKGLDYIVQELGATNVQVTEIARGIPSDIAEKLAHKGSS